MAVRQRVLLRDPRHFRAPGGLNFEKHFRLHQQEKARYFENLAKLSDDQRNLRTVTPGYIEGMTRRWIVLYHGEVAAAQYMGRAAHNVPFEYYEFIGCCVCQQVDELQHSEMDRDMLRRAGIPEAQWQPLWEACEPRAVFEHLLGLEDAFEIDLGDVPSLDYYTGLSLKVFVHGAGSSVGRGGRYDGLTGSFGRAEPAVGYVLNLDALTEVLGRKAVQD
jgi:hypothetical protein